MKVLAILVGAVAVLAIGPFRSAASTPQPPHAALTGRAGVLLTFHPLALAGLVQYPQSQPQQTGSSPTPSSTSTGATPTITPTPPAATPTATPNNQFPDPVDIFSRMQLFYSALQSTHFEEITDEDQLGVENVHIDATGDANCKNLGLKTHVKAAQTLEGTSQSQKLDEFFIQVKTKVWKKSKSTHHKWAKGKLTELQNLGLTIDAILNCPTATSSGGGGSGSSTTQLKDLVNLGPSTFKGIAVWHLRATLVDTTGQVTNGVIDFLIGQQHYVPYSISQSGLDTKNQIKFVFTQLLTKPGEKVTIKAPTVGSTKP